MAIPFHALNLSTSHAFDQGGTLRAGFDAENRIVSNYKTGVDIELRPRGLDDDDSPVTNWRCDYLWYSPFLVSTALIGKAGTLTGPMSGCWLFRYRMQGRDYLAHVGTGPKEDINDNKAVKAAWKTFANRGDATLIFGFNPYNSILTSELPKDGTVLGFVSAAGGFYTMVTKPDQTLSKESIPDRDFHVRNPSAVRFDAGPAQKSRPQLRKPLPVYTGFADFKRLRQAKESWSYFSMIAENQPVAWQHVEKQFGF